MSNEEISNNAVVAAGPVVEEVRFAVVMYGGIALCVYMSGITDTLLNMVIATARKKDSTEFLFSHSELKSDVQRVLRKAAQLHTAYRKKEISELPPHEGVAADCKFVIDILSGTSAGGLNNIFLAKALANEQGLENLANLWVQEGDIGKLLNDTERSKDDGYVKAENPPQSLLNSVRMQQKLLDAFVGMGTDRTEPSRLVDHLDLYITSTDLKGLEKEILVEAGTTAVERKNRAVFHLAYDPLGLPTVKGSKVDFRNDFTMVHTPFLSFIGRATSCIVPAFEPIMLNDLARLNYKDSSLAYRPKADSDRFAYFFPDYKPDEFQTRYFGDGGYGDNFPFGYAIDAIRRRTSNVSVDRVLLYVEPDPEVASDDGSTVTDNGVPPRPTFLGHIAAAASVKSTEKIREDVDRINEHSELLERIKHGLDEIKFAKVPANAEANEAYTNLRDLVAIDCVTDFVWELIKNPDRPFVQRRQVRWFVRGLKENLQGNFTASFDYETLRRRINFACRQIDEPLVNKKIKVNGLERPITADKIQHLANLRNQFSSLSLVIDRIPRLVRLKMSNSMAVGNYEDARDSVFKQASEWAQKQLLLEGLADDLVSKLAEVLQACDLTNFAKQIHQIIFGGKFEVSLNFAATVIKGPDFGPIQLASLNLINELKRQVQLLSEEFDQVFPDPFTLTNDFFKFDQKALPILYGVESVESTWVTLCRVSPLDSKTLESDPEKARKKLHGAGLAHFGGFFKDMWRVNDILWGQLDAVENLITKVVRQNCFARRELIFVGQLAVIKEFKLDVGGESKKELPPECTVEALRASLLKKAVEQFYKEIDEKKYDAREYRERRNQIAECISFALKRLGLEAWDPIELQALTSNLNPIYEKAPMSNTEQIQVAGRSLNVLDGMLETVGEDGKVGKTLSIVGRIFVTVSKILTPGSLHGSIYRHWLGLAIFFDATLLACGVFWPGVTNFALKASAATAAAAIILYCLDIAVNTKKGIRGGLAMLAAFALAGLSLWLLFSGKVKGWIGAMNSADGKPWHEKLIIFFKTDLGLQWALLSGLAIVVYLTWLRLQKADKIRQQGDPVLATVSTLVLVVIGLGIPGALLARDVIPGWVWYAGGACPALMVIMIFFGVFGRARLKVQEIEQTKRQIAPPAENTRANLESGSKTQEDKHLHQRE